MAAPGECSEIDRLRQELHAWRKCVREALWKDDCNRRKVVSLDQELQEAKKQYRNAMDTVALQRTKLQEVVQNYAALVPVIEKKNQLHKEVTSLREKLECAQKAHDVEMQRMKSQIEKEIEAREQAVETTKNEAEEKAKEKNEKHQRALQELKDLHRKERQAKENEVQKYLKTSEEAKIEHHREVENLRKRLQLMQHNMSSRATSNIDLFSNKLQAIKTENSREVGVYTSRISQLEKELATTQEALRHQERIAVMRSVAATWTATTPSSSPKKARTVASDALEGQGEDPPQDPEQGRDSNAPEGSDPPEASPKPAIKEPLRTSPKPSSQDKKRKLMSERSMLQEPCL